MYSVKQIAEKYGFAYSPMKNREHASYGTKHPGSKKKSCKASKTRRKMAKASRRINRQRV